MVNVYHGPAEISGQVYNYAKAIRSVGHDSTAGLLRPHEFGYEYDELIYPNRSPGKWESRLRRVIYFTKLMKKYDILNYWKNNTLLNNIDLQIASRLNIPTVMTFCGSQIRSIREAAKRSEFLDESTWPRKPREDDYFEHLNKHLDLAVYQYHELEPYLRKHFDNVAYVPRAIDHELITPQQSKTDETIRVAHAPTDRQLKGTKYVINAVDALKQRGYDIELMVIEGQHHEVVEKLQQANIMVDQLKIGTFGVTALEAMATETPVVCYMREDLREKYANNLPVVNANPKNLEQVLAELVNDSKKRSKIGDRGRDYVMNNHSLPVIGERLMSIYNELL